MTKFNKEKQKRFSRSFIMISCITIAAIIGLEIKEYASRKTQLESHMASYFESTINRLATILTKPLWNYEVRHLQDIANAEIKASDIISSILINESAGNDSPQVVVCIAKNESGQLINCPSHSKDKYIHKSQRIVRNDIFIGTLEICFSKEIIYKQVQDILYAVVLRLIFLIVIVTAGLYMAVRSYYAGLP